ncbi:MAG: ABC transporter substrate-binding protein, partial [Chthoniobacterales bacterium]
MTRHAALLLFLPLALAGCGKSPNDPGTSQAPSAIPDAPVQMEAGGEADPVADPKALKGGSFTIWGGSFPQSLNLWLDGNPVSIVVSPMLFEPLVTMHSTEDKPVGILAQSWEISPDQKTFTFKIDPNAKWSDGQPVTAEDVQFYYD